MQHLSIAQCEALRAALDARAAVLRAASTATLPNHSEETDDDAIVDLESALDVAALERNVRELGAVEAALERLHAPDFGACIDCAAGIPYTRLQANPLATRCTACQTVYERTHAQSSRPTL